MMNLSCDEYIVTGEPSCYEIGSELYKVLECNYCRQKERIEKRLNKVPGYIGDIWLSDFIGFCYAKKEKERGKEMKLEDMDLLPEVLDLLGRLLLERKIKTEKFILIDEGDGWDIKVKGWLDPCKFDNDNLLRREIAEWQENILKSYKSLIENYGKKAVDILGDIIPIMKSDCYEGEIEIE